MLDLLRTISAGPGTLAGVGELPPAGPGLPGMGMPGAPSEALGIFPQTAGLYDIPTIGPAPTAPTSQEILARFAPPTPGGGPDPSQLLGFYADFLTQQAAQTPQGPSAQPDVLGSLLAFAPHAAGLLASGAQGFTGGTQLQADPALMGAQLSDAGLMGGGAATPFGFPTASTPGTQVAPEPQPSLSVLPLTPGSETIPFLQTPTGFSVEGPAGIEAALQDPEAQQALLQGIETPPTIGEVSLTPPAEGGGFSADQAMSIVNTLANVSNLVSGWDQMNDLQRAQALAGLGLQGTQALGPDIIGQQASDVLGEAAPYVGAAFQAAGLAQNWDQMEDYQKAAALAQMGLSFVPGVGPLLSAAVPVVTDIGRMLFGQQPHYAESRLGAVSEAGQAAPVLADAILSATSPAEIQRALEVANMISPRARFAFTPGHPEGGIGIQAYEADLGPMSQMLNQLVMMKQAQFAGRPAPELDAMIQGAQGRLRSRLFELARTQQAPNALDIHEAVTSLYGQSPAAMQGMGTQLLAHLTPQSEWFRELALAKYFTEAANRNISTGQLGQAPDVSSFALLPSEQATLGLPATLTPSPAEQTMMSDVWNRLVQEKLLDASRQASYEEAAFLSGGGGYGG